MRICRTARKEAMGNWKRTKENRKAADAAYRERHRADILERQRARTERNREEQREYHRRYHAANKDKAKESGARSRAKPEVREKKRAYNATYQKAHRDKGNARRKRYYQKNKEQIRKARRDAYAANIEAERKAIKDYRKAHLKEYGEYMRIYLSNYRYIRKAREKAAGGRFTKEDISELFAKQKGKCATCKKKIAEKGPQRFHIDHVMPIKRGGSNDPGNLQLLCVSCNTRKRDKHPDDWAKENGLLF